MATQTPNYNLTKPDMTDYADIRVLNANMDILDTEMNKLAQNALHAIETNISPYSGYMKLSNNLIMQWGYVTPAASEPNIQHATLLLPMPNATYCVLVERGNGAATFQPDVSESAYTASFNNTTTGFDIICDHRDQGAKVFWFVIGG